MSIPTLYIPVNSRDLPTFFGAGIIMPSEYFKKESNDTKNLNAGSLLLTEVQWVDGYNCSIEIVFTEEEFKNLTQIDRYFYIYDSCIPVSRVKHIYFTNLEQKEVTLWNTNNGTGFIPERLATVVGSNRLATISKHFVSSKSAAKSKEIIEKINRFNVLLGGFAFMRLGAAPKSNFPKNYFVTLGYFNNLIAEQTSKTERDQKLEFDSPYEGLFSRGNKSKWTNWLQYIYSDISYALIQRIAYEQGISLNSVLGIIQPNDQLKDSILYDLILLATYGDNKPKGLEDLVAFLQKNDLPEEKQEEITLLFGLHIGYNKLRNGYRINNNLFKVKFELESKLDYYIIESIFQFAFNGHKESREFKYLDRIIPSSTLPTIPLNPAQGKTSNINEAPKKKDGSGDLLLKDFSEKLLQQLTKDFSQLSHPLIKIDNKEVYEYYSHLLSPLLKSVNEKLKDILQQNERAVTATEIKQVSHSLEQNHVIEDGLKELTATELKKLAKERKVVVPKTFRGTINDMNELIDNIRKAPLIL